MSMQNFWALGKTIYTMSNPREARRCVIFCIRAWLHRAKMRDIHQFFMSSELLRRIAQSYPFVYEQPTRAFFYNKSSFDERAALVKAHMQFLCERLREDCVLSLYRQKELPLWSGMECGGQTLSASLFFEPGQRKEGLLSGMLRLGRVPFYQIIFWIAPAQDGRPAMWIGAMQGPNMEHARDAVKQATKLCHGYRTKNLALLLAQAAARGLGLGHIYAVTNIGYYANNHVRIDRKLKTDFSEFWREAGGFDTADERFMELPLTETRKTMEEVPTRKRAVYRRRFALMDEIEAEAAEYIRRICRADGMGVTGV